MATLILLAAGTMVLLALAFALVLGWANVKFHVQQDPRIDAVLEALPGANCGACGLVGCADFAKAVVAGKAPPDGCPVGGPSVAHKVADILGIEVNESAPYRPVIHCAADRDKRLQLADYRGERTCFAANVIGDVQG
ncbi:MAG: RnfABCDGE type electron transport complex subunit B, partial [Planctomycetes bacterium]|nr:RnfABCDGE type electron transport complex subunit B [Planctomycetota bacterium]